MRLKVIFKNMYLSFRRFILHLIPTMKERNIKGIEIKSILVIRIDRIGDLIVSLAALKALKLTFPLARVSVLVREGNDALLKGVPWIDEVILYQGFIKTIRQLRKIQFDLAIDFLMDYPLRTALLVYLSKAKLIAGFDIEDRGCLFNLKFKPVSENKHMSQHILDLVKITTKSHSGIHIPVESFYPELPILEQNKEYIRSLLKGKGIQEEDFLVGIHPGGHYPSQRWFIERFSQLADRIIQKYKARVVVIGSLYEQGLVSQMVNLMQEKAVKVIGLSLDRLPTLISLFNLFICNNSGPLHIACALNMPTISTIGPTDPVLWWPMGENHSVVRKEIPCSPCNRAICKTHDCMRLITVDEMMEAVNKQAQASRVGLKI